MPRQCAHWLAMTEEGGMSVRNDGEVFGGSEPPPYERGLGDGLPRRCAPRNDRGGTMLNNDKRADSGGYGG